MNAKSVFRRLNILGILASNRSSWCVRIGPNPTAGRDGQPLILRIVAELDRSTLRSRTTQLSR